MYPSLLLTLVTHTVPAEVSLLCPFSQLDAEGMHPLSLSLTCQKMIFRKRERWWCVWVQSLAWTGAGVVHSVCVYLAVARESGCPGVVLGICPNQETQARRLGQRSSSDKKAVSVCLFSSFISFFLFSAVVPEGSVCQIWGAWSQGGPWPVVSLVPVVRLFQNLWRRGHVQGAFLHQPKVYTYLHSLLI